MRKIMIILLLIAVLSAIFPGRILAESDYDFEPNKIFEDQLDGLDLSTLQTFINQIDRDVGEYIPEINPGKIIKDMREGRLDLGFSTILNGLIKYLLHELIAHSSLMGKLVILSVLCAVLSSLLDAFEGSTGKIAHTMIYFVLITIALGSFTMAVNIGRNTIDQMVSLVQALLPILLTLLAAVGGISSTAILHPFLIAALGLLGTLIKNFVLPMIYFFAILTAANHINPKFRVSRLAALFKDIGVASLGLFLTLFVGFLGLQGIAGAVADSVTLKTAKFMTGTFIPVVGKTLADALEVVIGTSLLLKNAVGLVGVIILFILCAFPLIKILSMVIIYRLAVSLIQPFGDNEVADALHAMGNALTLVFAAVTGVALMFFMAISVIVGMGNINVMLR